MDKENLQILSISNIKNSYLIGFALLNFIIFAFYIASLVWKEQS